MKYEAKKESNKIISCPLFLLPPSAFILAFRLYSLADSR